MMDVNDCPVDCVGYNLFVPFSQGNGNSGNKIEARDIAVDIMMEVYKMSKDYTWCRDSFNLAIDKELGKLVLDQGFYAFSGKIFYGVCNFDEYFTLYLLLKITQIYSDSIASIYNSDGDIILIEAAQWIPSWLEPETSENRVYICNGNVHIIPPRASTGPSKDLKTGVGPMDLRTAIGIIIDGRLPTLAEPDVQRAIEDRARRASEDAKHTMVHNAELEIPHYLASVLYYYPHILPLAIHAIDGNDLGSMAKVTASNTFDTYTEIVRTVVPMSRVNYAQLSNIEIQPPKTNPELAMGVKSSSAYALGFKIACGISMVCSHKLKGAGLSLESYDFDNDEEWKTALRKYESLGYFEHASGPVEYSIILRTLMKMYLETMSGERVFIDNAKLVEECLLSKPKPELHELVTRKKDPDNWMDININDLEDYAAAFKHSGRDSCAREGLDPVHNPVYHGDDPIEVISDYELEDMEDLFNDFKSFIQSKSQYDGAVAPSNVLLQPSDDEYAESSGEGSAKEETHVDEVEDPDPEIDNPSDKTDTMSEYIQSMDREVGHNPSMLSFISADGSATCSPRKNVDMNANFADGLLKSLDSQAGAPGPASNLIKALNHPIPRPKVSKSP